MSEQEYESKFAMVRQAISAGLTYQVNLTFPMHAEFEGDFSGLFASMLRAQPNSYGATIDLDALKVVSASPELFLATEGKRMRTKPMKGTAPRGRYPAEDLRHAEQLRDSTKERASNMMIVDLLRNDLGRVAEPGSVEATHLFETEQHPTVWQLTSTIEATRREDVAWWEVVRATFPSGSVTGAPKVSTMDLIAEHEQAPRDVYCGAIGYLAPGLDASEFSVAIRTGVVADGLLTYHTGGGITSDSTSAGEYEECLWKTQVVTLDRAIPDLIETMAYQPDVGIPLLKAHLQRLSASASYWGIPYSSDRVEEAIYGLNPEYPLTIRLTLRSDGSIEVDSREASIPDEPVILEIPTEATVDPDHVLWFHKTADRERYPQTEDGVEMILVNLTGEVTETNISNLMARFDERWVTPPIDSGCLPGVYRRMVLEEGRVTEAPLTIDELKSADELAVTNAVRGWREATLRI